MNLFIRSIDKGGAPQVPGGGRDIAIDAGKRAEYRVPAGSRPVVYVLEGSVRFEGDDTPALAGDAVCFDRVPEGEEGVIGIEAEAPFRGVLLQRPPDEARTS